MTEIGEFESLLLEWEPITNIALSSLNSCLTKSFQDRSGNEYVVVVNRDCINIAFPTVTITRTGISRIMDVRDGYPVQFEFPGSSTRVVLDILPGDGRILRIE